MGPIIAGILVGLLLLVVVLVVKSYNQLVTLKNRVDNQGAQVDVQLKRRADLIPNLIETTKGYAGYEQGALSAVVELRGKMLHAASVQECYQANQELSGTLSRIFALGESYPELKANANFLKLQAELSDTEDKIAKARQFYNDTITKYNTAVQVFPGSAVAGLFGFRKVELLAVSAADRASVSISSDMFQI